MILIFDPNLKYIFKKYDCMDNDQKKKKKCSRVKNSTLIVYFNC